MELPLPLLLMAQPPNTKDKRPDYAHYGQTLIAGKKITHDLPPQSPQLRKKGPHKFQSHVCQQGI